MENVKKGYLDKNAEFRDGTNKNGEPYTMTTITVAGKKYSAFGKFEFFEGDYLQFVVEQNGKYYNFKNPVMITEASPEIKEEKVQSTSSPTSTPSLVSVPASVPQVSKVPVDSRQAAITLGQAYNQACEHSRFYQYVTSDTSEEAEKEYLKKLTKKHFKILQELQQEVL